MILSLDFKRQIVEGIIKGREGVFGNRSKGKIVKKGQVLQQIISNLREARRYLLLPCVDSQVGTNRALVNKGSCSWFCYISIIQRARSARVEVVKGCWRPSHVLATQN